MPTHTPTTAYPAAMSCGDDVSGRPALWAGASTSATDISARADPATASSARQTAVASTLGWLGSPGCPARGGAAPILPALRRSAAIAPMTVELAAIHSVQARLESQT